jgi:hypothetical protein
MSNFICNNKRCLQQRVKATVGQKHACGGTFVRLHQATVNVPMEKRTTIRPEGKGATATGASRKGGR